MHSQESGSTGGRDVMLREQTWRFEAGERFVRSWHGGDAVRRATERKIVLGVIHGLGDHSGRFDSMGRWFASRGVDVYCYDQIGHGRSPGPRVVIPNYEYLLNDIEAFIKKLTDLHPDSSVVLFGQSMGGNLVLNHQLREYSKAALAIAGAPMLRAVGRPGRLRMLLFRTLCKLAPNHTLSPAIDTTHLSRDPAEQRAYEQDPLVQKKISLRLGTALIDSGQWALDHATGLATRTLIAHGDADRITCHRASMEFAERSNGKAEVIVWPDGTHDLHVDIIREEYLSRVFDWVVGELDN